MPSAVPIGRPWLMGLGLFFLLLGLACVDAVFLCLLIGRGSAGVLIGAQIAAALLVFGGLVLLKFGAPKKPAGAPR